MNITIGTRIPPCLGAESMEQIAAWLRETGLDTVDLPSVDSQAVEVCRQYGLKIGTVDARDAGGLIHPNELRRKQTIVDIVPKSATLQLPASK